MVNRDIIESIEAEKRAKRFVPSLLGSTSMMAVLAMGLATPTFAQETEAQETEADEEEFEEIIVTGIRANLQMAREIKRNADTAVDSITSADASGLPDLSVSEALARVPGLVVQRIGLGASDGDFPSPEGGENLVRGLQLVRTEFNGRDAFTANGGRSLDFGTVPPEMIGSVDVYKNSSADLIQGGIGGTINLRTLEPFDRPEGFLIATVDGTYTDLRDEITPDVTVIAGDRWDLNGGEFGLIGSYSNSSLKSELHGFQVGQLYAIPLDGENIAIPGGFQLRTNEVDRDREAFYAAAQYRNEGGTFEFVAKYARIENTVTSDERTLEWFGDGEMWAMTGVAGDYTTTPFTSSGLPQCNGSNDPDAANASCENTNPVTGLLETGVITNTLRDWTGSRGTNMSTLGIHQEDRSMTDDISLNMKFTPSDNWTVDLDVHKTRARFNRDRLWAGARLFSDFSLNPDLDNPEVTLVPRADNNPFRPECVWGGCTTPLSTELADPANTFLMFAADEFQDNDGDMVAFEGDVEYEFDGDGWFDAVKFGARYAERDQVNRSAGLNWAGIAPPWSGGYYLPLGDTDIDAESVDFSDFMGGGVVTGDNTSVAFVDRALLSDYDAFAAAIQNEPLAIAIADWQPLRQNGVVDYAGQGTIGDVVEKTTDFYVRLDFGQEFDNGMMIDANFGVRYTKSTVSGTGELDYLDVTDEAVRLFAPDAAEYFDQVSEDRSGTFSDVDYWLPSFNVKWALDEKQLIRFAASKAITRPNISQLRSGAVAVPSFRFDVDNTGDLPVFNDIIPTAINLYGGNPDLQAIESWNFDLSYEVYFGEQDSFTFALFKKDITDNIIYESVTLDTVMLDGVEVPIIFNGDLNQDKADLKGFEVAYQQFYDFLPGILGNLGLQANYTFIDAKTNAPVPVNDAGSVDPAAGDAFARIYRYNVPEYLGLSKHTANIIGIYQDDKLELRLAYNWRSSHLSSYRDFVTGNPIYQTSRGYLDGSIRYQISDMMEFRLQVANITNTIAKAEQQIDADGQRFGRTAFMGDRRIKAGLKFSF